MPDLRRYAFEFMYAEDDEDGIERRHFLGSESATSGMYVRAGDAAREVAYYRGKLWDRIAEAAREAGCGQFMSGQEADRLMLDIDKDAPSARPAASPADAGEGRE
jgi:hypothetical protein